VTEHLSIAEAYLLCVSCLFDVHSIPGAVVSAAIAVGNERIWPFIQDMDTLLPSSVMSERQGLQVSSENPH
jgi:hypothetical protein